MQSFKRIISLLLLLVVAASAIANVEADFQESFNEVFKRQSTCTSIPCSGNTTCLNYGCGYCMETHCEPEEMKKTTPTMPAMTPAMTPAAAGNTAAAMSIAGPLVAVAIGIAAAGLL